MHYRATQLTIACLMAVGVINGPSAAAQITEVSTAHLLVKDQEEAATSFTISGPETSKVVIRGLGPSLEDSRSRGKGGGHGSVLKDPKITLLMNGRPLARNDNWREGRNAADIPEELRPAFDVEAALAVTLAPGTYEVRLESAGKDRRRFQGLGEVSVTQVDSEVTTGCPNIAPACATIIMGGDGESAVCQLQSTATCGADLSQVVDEVNVFFSEVTTATPFWMQALGGSGGSAKDGKGGGSAGYAQTTTSVNDILNEFNSTQIFYFIGENGPRGGETCGGGGGAATLVTMEDLSLNPGQSPDGSQVLLLAAGGGGAGGADPKAPCETESSSGARGTPAIALQNADVFSPGRTSDSTNCPGQAGVDGSGGASCSTAGDDDGLESGKGGFGGFGGAASSGNECNFLGGRTQFQNTKSVNLTFEDGRGGDGGSKGATCDAGGGGGGGGHGGGGGGGHGNASFGAAGGGSGASYARAATELSSLAPSTQPSDLCGAEGCVQINFDLTQ